MARASRNIALPQEHWPERDHSAWARALQPGDVLGRGGPASHWSPATRTWAVEAYAQWLGWLDRGQALDPDVAPDRRVTRERITRYLAHMREDLADATVAGRIRGLWRIIDVMVAAPSCTFLPEVVRRLPYEPAPAPCTVGTHDLLDLGLRQMIKADESEERNKIAATAYRNGLMIALLSLVPLRRRNFAGLELGRTILRVDNEWRIRFPGSETKTGRHIDKPVPRGLVASLERYLSIYYPQLPPMGSTVASGTGPLWLSTRTGKQMSGHSINLTIGAVTEVELGERVNLHKFRKAAPTTLAIHAPDKISLGVVMLDHTDERTTGILYNMADAFSAAERWQSTLDLIRKELHT